MNEQPVNERPMTERPMTERHWRDLVGEVRRLTDEIAPFDPDTASAAFDRLVRTYGRGPAGAALMAVAPGEIADLSGQQ